MVSLATNVPLVAESDLCRLLDVPEMSRRLNLSECTVRRAVDRGELPAVMVGKSMRFSWPAVLSFLMQREQLAVQPTTLADDVSETAERAELLAEIRSEVR
jgi:excisionase family DNA binding protein